MKILFNGSIRKTDFSIYMAYTD